MKTRRPQKKEKLSTLSSRNTIQVSVEASWLVQKKALSTPLSLTSLSWLSYTQTSLPSSVKSLHHLNPTSSLPVTFLTTQKSTPASTVTIINTKTSEKMRPKKKYPTTASTLNMNVAIQANGCVAMLRS